MQFAQATNADGLLLNFFSSSILIPCALGQVCTHPALAADAGEEEDRAPSARLALLDRLLPRLLATGRRVLLLSQTAPAVDLLQVSSHALASVGRK